jgi:hypothetical protein
MGNISKINGSLINADTASFVTTAQTASYVENAQTASFVTTAQTASYVENAQTASFVNTLNQSVTITGAITASSNISASGYLVAQNITASGDISSSGTITGNTVKSNSYRFPNDTVRLRESSTANNAQFYGGGLEVTQGTGNITASGNISASGTVTADKFRTGGGSLAFYGSSIGYDALHIGFNSGQRISIGKDPTTDIQLNGNITASGNISASGNIVAQDFATPGNITASGNISASGTIFGTFQQITGITVSQASWTLDSGLYEYDISDASITSNTVVDVIPDNADYTIVLAAQLLPANVSSAGAVKIFAVNEPTDDIDVTLNLFK